MEQFLFQALSAFLLFYIVMGIGYTVILFKTNDEAKQLWRISKIAYVFVFGLSVIVWLPMEMEE